MTDYITVRNLLITKLTASMDIISRDYIKGEKTMCYGWWATPNCESSKVQGDKFALLQSSDRQKLFNDHLVQQLLSHSLLFYSCMKITDPSDKARFEQCLILGYEYSKTSENLITMPNKNQMSWGNFITRLYSYHIESKQPCTSRSLEMPTLPILPTFAPIPTRKPTP